MNYIGYIKKLLNQPIGAIPIGLSITVGGVKFGFERQFEIDGKIRLDVVSDKKKVVSIDGVFKNKPMQVKKLTDYVLKNTKLKQVYLPAEQHDAYELSEGVRVNSDKYKTIIEKKFKKLVNNLSKEVSDYNKSKKSTFKKSTSKKSTPKKSTSKKSTPRRKNIKNFIEDYTYIFSADPYKAEARIYDAQENDLKKFKKFITDYNSKVDDRIKTIKKDAKIAKKKGVFYNEKGLLEDMIYYNLDGTKSKSKKIKTSPPKKSPPKKSNKRVITKKGKAGNLVYVGREKVGMKMLYQYEYKNIPKKK